MAKDRELVEPNPGDKRYVRRDDQGRFTKDQVDVGKAISQDMQRESKPALVLFDCYRLGQVARLIDVRATAHRDIVGQQLQRHDIKHRLEQGER